MKMEGARKKQRQRRLQATKGHQMEEILKEEDPKMWIYDGFLRFYTQKESLACFVAGEKRWVAEATIEIVEAKENGGHQKIELGKDLGDEELRFLQVACLEL